MESVEFGVHVRSGIAFVVLSKPLVLPIEALVVLSEALVVRSEALVVLSEAKNLLFSGNARRAGRPDSARGPP